MPNGSILNVTILQRPPGTRDMMNFCHQFASMLSAGIPVLKSLEILADQLESSVLRDKIRSAMRKIVEGESLTDALSGNKDIFSPFFMGMAEAGEVSGRLDQVFFRLAGHYKNREILEQKIKTATGYPKLVILLVSVVIIILLAFVLPNFERTFINMGVEPPLLTQMLLAAGKVIRLYWQSLLGFVLLLFLLFHLLAKTDRYAYYRDVLLLRFPIIGSFNQKKMISEFCRVLSTMIASGVELLTALDLSINVVGNIVFIRGARGAGDLILRGESVANALAATGFFPSMVIGMVNVGEESGKLEEMLAEAAVLYETEVNYVAERLGAILEPLLIIFLSLVVGGIVLSVFLPLFSIFNNYL